MDPDACADCGYLRRHSRCCPTRVDALEARIALLEALAHPPFTQTRIEERLTRVEESVSASKKPEPYSF